MYDAINNILRIGKQITMTEFDDTDSELAECINDIQNSGNNIELLLEKHMISTTFEQMTFNESYDDAMTESIASVMETIKQYVIKIMKFIGKYVKKFTDSILRSVGMKEESNKKLVRHMKDVIRDIDRAKIGTDITHKSVMNKKIRYIDWDYEEAIKSEILYYSEKATKVLVKRFNDVSEMLDNYSNISEDKEVIKNLIMMLVDNTIMANNLSGIPYDAWVKQQTVKTQIKYDRSSYQKLPDAIDAFKGVSKHTPRSFQKSSNMVVFRTAINEVRLYEILANASSSLATVFYIMGQRYNITIDVASIGTPEFKDNLSTATHSMTHQIDDNHDKIIDEIFNDNEEELPILEFKNRIRQMLVSMVDANMFKKNQSTSSYRKIEKALRKLDTSINKQQKNVATLMDSFSNGLQAMPDWFTLVNQSFVNAMKQAGNIMETSLIISNILTVISREYVSYSKFLDLTKKHIASDMKLSVHVTKVPSINLLDDED